MYILDEQGKKNQIEEYAEMMIDREKYDKLQSGNPPKGEFDDLCNVVSMQRSRPKHINNEPNDFDGIMEVIAFEGKPGREKSEFDDIFD